MLPMTLGELFLEAIATGVITNGEMAWVTAQQADFDRTEEAVAAGTLAGLAAARPPAGKPGHWYLGRRW